MMPPGEGCLTLALIPIGILQILIEWLLVACVGFLSNEHCYYLL